MLCSCPRSFDEVPLDDRNNHFAAISESYSTWPSENGRASEATVLVSRIEEALESAQNFMDVLETQMTYKLFLLVERESLQVEGVKAW